MSKMLNFPKEAFSEKELLNLKQRVKVIKLMRVGETWEKIKKKTGAHLQTIALVTKRIRATSSKRRHRDVENSQVFQYTFGQKQE